MEQKQAISGLKDQGWGDRRIAKELRLNRRAVVSRWCKVVSVRSSPDIA